MGKGNKSGGGGAPYWHRLSCKIITLINYIKYINTFLNYPSIILCDSCTLCFCFLIVSFHFFMFKDVSKYLRMAQEFLKIQIYKYSELD